MMIKSLYAVALFLIASVIVADAECELGPVKDVHFEMDKVLGQWYVIYHQPNDAEKNVGCNKLSIEYVNASTIVSVHTFYNKSTEKFQHVVYTVPRWNSTSFTQEIGSAGGIYTSTYFIVAVDYKNYIVVKSCLKGCDKPVTWIGFRRCNPDEHTIKEAMDSLDAEGGSSDTLEKVEDCVYPK